MTNPHTTFVRTCSDCEKRLSHGTKGTKCRACLHPPRPEKHCVGCGISVSSRQNKSGLCRRCLMARINADPALVAKRDAGSSLANKDPEKRARMRAYHKANLSTDPAMIEMWREAGKRNYALTIGSELARARALDPEVLARRGQTRSATMLSWCPPAYRDEYRWLNQRRGIPAAAARAQILRKVEADNLRRLATYDNLTAAADHLRHYAPVFKRDDGYLYGTVRLTPEELVKRALLRGWQPMAMAA